jgi:hypothetical protein
MSGKAEPIGFHYLRNGSRQLSLMLWSRVKSGTRVSATADAAAWTLPGKRA